MKDLADYKSDLLNDLRRNSAYVAQYLSAAKKDSKEALLVALQDVRQATRDCLTCKSS